MIHVITEIAEDCQGFEFSLLGRYYGYLIGFSENLRIFEKFQVEYVFSDILST